MARSQNNGRSLDQRIAEPHAADTVVFDLHAGHFRTEQHLATGIGNTPAHRSDDPRQAVGTDVRMRIVQDRLVGAVETEHLERTAVVAALFGTGEEFAVGIGTRTAFAECVIGIGIDRTVAVDLRDVALARRHVAAPLQHDRFEAQFDQPQRREKSRRARSHHDHRCTVVHIRIVEPDFGRTLLTVHINLETEVYPHTAAACVDRTAHDTQQSDPRRIDTQALRHQRCVQNRVGGLFGGEYKREFCRHFFGIIG